MNTDRVKQHSKTRSNRPGQGGYALIGLMGVIMFAMILSTAAAPTIKLETQREREEEMLWRGQQVARALSLYAAARGNQYPTDLKELVDGVTVGIKKMHLLRPSALCDPMTPCDPDRTNWRLIRPGDPLAKELLDAYVATQQKVPLPPPPQSLVVLAQVGATKLPGQAADTQLDGNIGSSKENNTESNSGSSFGQSEKGPIVGVVSRKSDKMFRPYFGIEEYDHAAFIAGVSVYAGGFINPFILTSSVAGNANTGAPTNAAQADCQKRGGLFFQDQCFGVLNQGQQCRGPDNTIIPCPKK